MKLYSIENGNNAYFIENGKVMATYDGVIRESILTVQELNDAIKKGFVMPIEPRNATEMEIVREANSDRKLEWSLIGVCLGLAASAILVLAVMY